jgi:hypothetical protein
VVPNWARPAPEPENKKPYINISSISHNIKKAVNISSINVM